MFNAQLLVAIFVHHHSDTMYISDIRSHLVSTQVGGPSTPSVEGKCTLYHVPERVKRLSPYPQGSHPVSPCHTYKLHANTTLFYTELPSCFSSIKLYKCIKSYFYPQDMYYLAPLPTVLTHIPCCHTISDIAKK